MSQLLSPTVNDVEPVASASAKRNPWIKSLKWIFLFVALLWAADTGVSFLIQHTRLRGKLTERLEAAFGRPVDVGSYDFSLWDGPALQAHSVTVAEDPRFGHEYFLHTESLTVRLLWASLLRGQIGLGTLSLTQPSLNLVRNPDGNWNISEWLPAPAGTAAQFPQTSIGPRLALRPLSFRRIEINGGRINFKRGDEKLPFAFADVNGAVEAESRSRWRIDLNAAPWRAATELQQAGMLHLSGDAGGTSSRLLPATLQFSWTDASLSDVLRLARGDDSGLRGSLGLTVDATTQGETWNLQVRTELRQIHRWDLALRPDNPAVNVIARLQWSPHVSELDLTDATIESPHSNAHATGMFSWDRAESRTVPAHAIAGDAENAEVQILTSTIDLQDALSWVRAFRSGIAENIGIQGSAGVRMALAGWPPVIEQSRLTTEGAVLSNPNLRVPVHLGPASIIYTKSVFSLPGPVTLSFGDEASALRIYEIGARESATGRNFRTSPSHFHVAGKLAQVRDLTAAAGLFGWNLSRGWDIEGPVSGDLQWSGNEFPWQGQPAGFVEWGTPGDGANDASLRVPFLNEPIGHIAAHADFKLGATQLAVTSAQAFGAHWSGTFDRPNPAAEWQFALSADHLAAADLDRWLNPRSQDNFLDRMLPFLNGSSQAIAVPEGLRAAGHISVDRFTLAPVVVNALAGDLTLGGRHISLANATGSFYGGTVSGALDADLRAVPDYRVDVDFSRADLTSLLAELPALASLSAGSASGSASFEARGGNRDDLLASLTCAGKGNVSDLSLSDIDLLRSLRLAQMQPGSSEFQDASASFRCANDRILFDNFELSGSGVLVGGSGTVNFNRNLDLRLRVLSDDSVGPRLTKSAVTPDRFYQLTGSLDSPQIAPVQSAAARRVR